MHSQGAGMADAEYAKFKSKWWLVVVILLLLTLWLLQGGFEFSIQGEDVDFENFNRLRLDAL